MPGLFIKCPFELSAVVRNISFGLTIVGFLLGVGALIEFRKARTTLDPHGSLKSMLVSGVFDFSPNPIYLGFLLMGIGLPPGSGFCWGIFMAPFFVVIINRQGVEREEA